METRFRERRRNYYIKKEFQRNFIMKFCGLVVLGALISGIIIYSVSRSTVTTTFVDSRLTIKTTADYILPTILLSGVIVVVLTGLATIFITLFASHRIAGPLYRMEKDVEKVASGDLTMRFVLRSGDEIKALAIALGMMARNLREGVAAVKMSLASLEEALGRSDAGGEIAKRITRLRSDIEKFKT